MTIPYTVDLKGQATTTDLCGSSDVEAENAVLVEGTEFYHYFSSGRELFDSIKTMRRIASRAHCKCSDCLRRSMTTREPHYGDGAYGTLNTGIEPTRGFDPVVAAHGINPGMLPFRAVVRLINPSEFVKFQGTGGVVRSCPVGPLTRDELVFTEDTQAIVIRIEKWDGQKWVPQGDYDE